jgi:pyruvate formate lyase activating enzyme
MFYSRADNGAVHCELCPLWCEVDDGERGICSVRENQKGALRTLVYERVCTLNVDPIEKKPFFHYLPGTQAVSIATAGCNFTCKFCQNWEISQAGPDTIPHQPLSCDQLAQVALDRAAPTLAYTYNEPVVFYEYVHDAAKRAREKGVGSVVVSDGFIAEKPMRQWCEQLTAVKVDLKAFTDKYYRDICGGALQPVLDALKVVRSTGIHLEIVVLLVPTLNDSLDETKRMCAWIVKELGGDVPVHFSRFHPTYRLRNLPVTPAKTVESARDAALAEGVRYAYVGNLGLHDYGHTYCHSCKTRLIQRAGYRIAANLITADGKCPKCATPIPGVWSQKQALAFKPKA